MEAQCFEAPPDLWDLPPIIDPQHDIEDRLGAEQQPRHGTADNGELALIAAEDLTDLQQTFFTAAVVRSS